MSGAAFAWSLGFSFSRAYVILATIHDIASSGGTGRDVQSAVARRARKATLSVSWRERTIVARDTGYETLKLGHMERQCIGSALFSRKISSC